MIDFNIKDIENRNKDIKEIKEIAQLLESNSDKITSLIVSFNMKYYEDSNEIEEVFIRFKGSTLETLGLLEVIKQDAHNISRKQRV